MREVDKEKAREIGKIITLIVWTSLIIWSAYIAYQNYMKHQFNTTMYAIVMMFLMSVAWQSRLRKIISKYTGKNEKSYEEEKSELIKN